MIMMQCKRQSELDSSTSEFIMPGYVIIGYEGGKIG